jgi:hypothetical protein
VRNAKTLEEAHRFFGMQVTEGALPPGVVEFRDPKTGAVVGRIVHVSTGEEVRAMAKKTKGKKGTKGC